MTEWGRWWRRVGASARVGGWGAGGRRLSLPVRGGSDSHPGSLVAVVVGATMVVGMVGQVVGGGEPPRPELIDLTDTGSGEDDGEPESSPRPILVVEPGDTPAEVVAQAERLGIDSDRFLALVNDPGWAGLEGSTWETDSLAWMLYPGEYSILSANPQELLGEMLSRLRADAAVVIEPAARERGWSMAGVLDQAALVQAATSRPAEMPAVAELVALGVGPATGGVAPSREAMTAVLWPTNFGVGDPGDGLGGVGDPADGGAEDAADDGVGDAVDGDTGLVTYRGLAPLDALLRPPNPVAGQVASAVGQGPIIEGGHRPHTLFEMGGLDALATALVVARAVEQGRLAPDDRVPVSEHQLTRELPDDRPELRVLDVAAALRLVTDEGNQTAVDALIALVGVDEVEAELARVGATATSLRSRPRVTTAADVARMAQALHTIDDDGVGGRFEPGPGSLLDRFLQRPGGSRMATDVANRSGYVGFSVRASGLYHDVGRLLSAGRERIVVHLGENGHGSIESARHTSHVTALHARSLAGSFDQPVAGCRFPAEGGGALEGMTIGVDPEHGGTDRGTTHQLENGTVVDEASLNLALALAVTRQLAARGAEVVMTRCDDVDVGVGERAHTLNGSEVDLTLGIRTDKLGGPEVNQPSVGFYAAAARPWAESIVGDPSLGIGLGVAVSGRPTVKSTDPALLVLSVGPAVTIEAVSLRVAAQAEAMGAALAGDNDRIDAIAIVIAATVADRADLERESGSGG